VEDIGGPDQFDNWAYARDHRYDESRSAQYLSHDVVGYEDLDDNGDWRDDSNYGHVWFPNQVAAGWAPYHEGHWDWISPWGYTWVDDSPWGYAPFHYGRWVTCRRTLGLGGRTGRMCRRCMRPRWWSSSAVAPAASAAMWDGSRSVRGKFMCRPYQVSRGYVTRVNISNTTVNNVTDHERLQHHHHQ
jgi:hypothetical protein